MPAPRLSVLIPTLNAEPYLPKLLAALQAQRSVGEVELCVIDSSSDDRTVALLEAAGAKVRIIERSEFRHGPTRNALAEEARGEFFVYLSQDALPADEDCLAALIAPLESDPAIAGSTGRVLPHAEDDPLTARTVLSAPEASEQEVLFEGSRGGVRSTGQHPTEPPESSGAERGPRSAGDCQTVRFNNVISCLRAAAWREIPFQDLPFGEDSAWAASALERGWKIAFAPGCVVHHAHRYNLRQAFERYRVDAAFHRRVHGARLRPTLFSVARGILWEVREDLYYVFRQRRGYGHLWRSPLLRAAQVLGQFWGTRGWGAEGTGEATRAYR